MFCYRFYVVVVHIVVNIYRLGGMVSFLHLFLYQMVYDRVESYPQSCLLFILTSFCSVYKVLVWVVIGRGCSLDVSATLMTCPSCSICWYTQENASGLF